MGTSITTSEWLDLNNPWRGKGVFPASGSWGQRQSPPIGTNEMAHHLGMVLHCHTAARILNIVFLLAWNGADRERLLMLQNQLALTYVLMPGTTSRSRCPFHRHSAV